jgi:hypothetical protein
MVINLNAHIDKFFPHQYSLQVVFVLKEITDFNSGNSSQSKVGSIAFEIRNQFIKHLTVVRILVFVRNYN